MWLASPLHLVAGLNQRPPGLSGLLKLDDDTISTLCRDFAIDFAARGFSLVPLASGGLIACGPAFSRWPQTRDPSRLLGAGIADGTVSGAGAAPLLMLGAELEMWLHAHPLNAQRLRRREAPLTSLWLWGGGAPLSASQLAVPGPLMQPQLSYLTVFGADPVAAGLCAASGARLRATPVSAHAMLDSGAGAHGRGHRAVPHRPIATGHAHGPAAASG